MSASSMSDRFRRAIQNDDLMTAKRIYDRANAQDEIGNSSTKSFDVRNQATLPSSIHDPFHPYYTSSNLHSNNHQHYHHHGINHSQNDSRSMHSMEALGHCLGLSASQFQSARQSRIRERNREAAQVKPSLAIAIESGASIELIQWLLEMGHERGDFSRDIRGCTAVSLAAQHNRPDVIEACCIDAVAHAATLHHQRSLMYYGYRNNLNSYYEDGDEDIEGYERNSQNSEDENDKNSDGDLSPALSLVTAAASTPSRRPSPNPMYHSKAEQSLIENKDDQEIKEVNRKDGKDDANSSADESSEMDDIVGVTITRVLDCPDELGRTALALASMKGHENVVRLLVELGATLDLGDFEGNRPLHYAAAYNQLIVVQLLIERGCSFAAKNLLGFTAADYAWNASLKSALEAFARAQFDVQRVRVRKKGGGLAESPQIRQASKMAIANNLQQNENGDKNKSFQNAALYKNIGLFPAQMVQPSPEASLPPSPQLGHNQKSSSQRRELY